jgi:Ca2+-binding RTX toxin-like protein
MTAIKDIVSDLLQFCSRTWAGHHSVVLSEIPIIVTSDMDTPSFCDGFNTHHSGTLRCRWEGASKPSTEPGGGNDTIYDNDNSPDTVCGGAGNDTFSFSNSPNAAPNVTIENSGTLNFNGQLVSENVYLNFENITGNSSKNILTGNDQTNVLDGGDNDDTLYGCGGNDTLIGGTGKNALYGGTGDDTLYGDDAEGNLFGDDGNDALFGGQG